MLAFMEMARNSSHIELYSPGLDFSPPPALQGESFEDIYRKISLESASSSRYATPAEQNGMKLKGMGRELEETHSDEPGNIEKSDRDRKRIRVEEDENFPAAAGIRQAEKNNESGEMKSGETEPAATESGKGRKNLGVETAGKENTRAEREPQEISGRRISGRKNLTEERENILTAEKSGEKRADTGAEKAKGEDKGSAESSGAGKIAADSVASGKDEELLIPGEMPEVLQGLERDKNSNRTKRSGESIGKDETGLLAGLKRSDKNESVPGVRQSGNEKDGTEKGEDAGKKSDSRGSRHILVDLRESSSREGKPPELVREPGENGIARNGETELLESGKSQQSESGMERQSVMRGEDFRPMQSESSVLFSRLKEELNDKIVKQSAIILKNDKSGEIRLNLKPEELGSIRIRISMEDNRIAGRIFVENSTIRELVEQNLQQLYRAFREEGFDTGGLDVFVGDRGNGGNREGKGPALTKSIIDSLEEQLPVFGESGYRENLVDLMA